MVVANCGLKTSEAMLEEILAEARAWQQESSRSGEGGRWE